MKSTGHKKKSLDASTSVEFGGEPLASFTHPPMAVYLLGSEANGLPERILKKCDAVVEIESVNAMLFNVAVSGTLVMYMREIQLRRR